MSIIAADLLTRRRCAQRLLRLAGLCLLAAVQGCRRPPPAIPPTEHAPHTVKALDAFSTEQLRVFLRGYSGDWRDDNDRARGVAMPPAEKPYPTNAPLIALVRPEALTLGMNAPLATVINARRSRRGYTSAPLSNEELSYLLWCTQGVSGIATNADGIVDHHFRTVPSGGGRHPFETYLAVRNVSGLAPGLYRFLPFEHKLLPIREDPAIGQQVQQACYGQSFVGDAAVVFVWTAIPYRTEWKYGFIAHRMIAIEAGHVCENLYLAVESIGAGTCALLGYSQPRMDALLGVDGTNEFTIYVAPVGKIPPADGL